MGDGGDIRAGQGDAARTRWSGRAPLAATWGLALALAVVGAGLIARPAWSQQVYSFADIMAALTVRLPVGQTIPDVQPLTLQEAVRSLTLEQAPRHPANVARIAGVMAQVRRDDVTRRAVHGGIAAALDSLVASGRLAPLGRDLMMEQVGIALGLAGPPALSSPSPASPSSTSPARPPVTPGAIPPAADSGPLPPPDPPLITAPVSRIPAPAVTTTPEAPPPRAAPVPPATTATLPPAHLAPPSPPPMPSNTPATAPSPYPAPPGTAPGPPGGAPPYASATPSPYHPAPPYPPTYATPAPSPYPAPGTVPAPTPWQGLGPQPGQALFPSTITPGTLMDLPPEVTAPPATVADSGS